MRTPPDTEDKREVVFDGDELLDAAQCPNCGMYVSDDGITVDPRGCCFYCKAD